HLLACCRLLRPLPPFPTRRSSDLPARSLASRTRWARSLRPSVPRRRCGEAGAPSPLRFGAAEWSASIGRRARRLIGAPTAPPPPRCAIRPRARAARRSPAHREQAGDGLSSLHVPRHDEVRDEWDLACAALNLRRLRVLGVAAALARPPAARGGSPRSGTAQHGSG